MRKETIHTGYLPRSWQDTVHQDTSRFKVLVLHRRAGKTVCAVNEIIDRALRCEKRNPAYAYIGVTYGSVKRIAWDMMKEFTKHIPGIETNEQDLTVKFPRPHRDDHVKIMLLGSENPGSIRGIYLDGVVLDEYAEIHPDVWNQVIRPALSDRTGWGIFSSTPKGYNGFYEMAKIARTTPGWFYFELKASQSGILPEDELQAARVTMSEEEYEQEYECSFGAALIGAYYGKQIAKAETDKRITKVPYERAVPVETYWDLGIGDTTVIWYLQLIGREYHLIDYTESSGVGLDWYVREMKNKDYIYAEHILPHDAHARELGTGKTREETLKELWPGIRTRVLPRQNVDDGIHAARMLFDNCWFDEKKCRRGIDALRAYERKWDSKNKIFTAKPLHNWASHGADGFRTFAMGVRSPERRNSHQSLPTVADSDYDVFNFSAGGDE